MANRKLFEITADGLNEYAAAVFDGAVYLSRRPSTPSFWFANLAIDSDAATWTGSARELLSENTLRLIDLFGLAAFDDKPEWGDEQRERWCTCVDEAAPLILHRANGGAPIEHRGRAYEPCWSCLFGAHDRCDRCDTTGEIHFPETIMVKTKAVA